MKGGSHLLTQELGIVTSDPVVQIRLPFSSVKVKAVHLYAVQARRGSRGIALPILNLGAEWGWPNLLAEKIRSTYCAVVTRSSAKPLIGLWSEWLRN